MLLVVYVALILLIHYGLILTYSISFGHVKNKWASVPLLIMPIASMVYYFLSPQLPILILFILSMLFFLPLLFINTVNLFWLNPSSSSNDSNTKTQDAKYQDYVMFLI